MEIDFFSSMSAAASMLFQPGMLLYLLIGVVVGSLLSVIPGVGGLMGIALLLPFTFGMPAHEALIFLIAALAVMSTSDSIPAILFGIPGTPTSMVTVLDGYPMAQRGEAGRALGAAFSASVIGGVIGAIVLVVIIPLVMPLLMKATSPELLAFCILGLAMVGGLAGSSMAKGIGAAMIGIMLAFIGQDPNTATLRWTFDSIYLWDGLHLLVVALGLYAIPELADLAIKNQSIAGKNVPKKVSGMVEGTKDTLKNLWPVGRNSGISSFLGIIPAIGPAIIPWLIYSYTTMRAKKEGSQFGKGDVRGVIASESANNATVGGSLLPTVALGIPGSAPMAFLLGALLLHGIAPGPNMLTTDLNITYLMMWGIVGANVLGGIFALMLVRPLAKVVFVKSSVLVPLISGIVFMGVVQSTRQWEDALFLLLVGAAGWIMKRVRWPRAPLFLAFILAPLVERYFFMSMNLHGWSWTTRPIVAVLLAITVVFVAGVFLKHFLKQLRNRRGNWAFRIRPKFNLESVFAIVVIAGAAIGMWLAREWPSEAMTMPIIVGVLTIVCALFALMDAWFEAKTPSKIEADDQHFDIETDFGELTPNTIALRAGRFGLFLVAYGILAWVIGIIPATPIFLAIFMVMNGVAIKLAATVAVLFTLFVWLVFDYLLRLPWPVPVFDVLGMI